MALLNPESPPQMIDLIIKKFQKNEQKLRERGKFEAPAIFKESNSGNEFPLLYKDEQIT